VGVNASQEDWLNRNIIGTKLRSRPCFDGDSCYSSICEGILNRNYFFQRLIVARRKQEVCDVAAGGKSRGERAFPSPPERRQQGQGHRAGGSVKE
jgi:hypothetical protein